MTKPLLAILLLLQLSLILVGCSDPMEEPGEEILVFDFNANLQISSDSEVVVKVGGNIIEEGGKLELGDDWVYLKKSNREPFTGVLVSYHPTGELHVRALIREGRNHGLYESFQKDGTLSSRMKYAHGELHGPYEIFHDTGWVEFRGTYKNGLMNGIWVYYLEDQSLQVVSNYKGGELRDHWCFRDAEMVGYSACEFASR